FVSPISLVFFFFLSSWLFRSLLSSLFPYTTLFRSIPIVLGLIVKLILRKTTEKVIPAMPLVSVIAITAIVTAVVAGSKEQIIETGLLIFGVVILHNGLGYFVGFIIAKLFKQPY